MDFVKIIIFVFGVSRKRAFFGIGYTMAEKLLRHGRGGWGQDLQDVYNETEGDGQLATD